MMYFPCFELSNRLVMAIPANLLMMRDIAGLSFFAITGTEKRGSASAASLVPWS